ncbi:hypothetical protein D3C75_1075430 [compost metagenome]
MHIAGAFGGPEQGGIASEAAFLQHLIATCAIDPHDAVVVFRHFLDQHGQQLIHDTLAFAGAFEDGQRRQVAQHPEQSLLGRGNPGHARTQQGTQHQGQQRAATRTLAIGHVRVSAVGPVTGLEAMLYTAPCTRRRAISGTS